MPNLKSVCFHVRDAPKGGLAKLPHVTWSMWADASGIRVTERFSLWQRLYISVGEGMGDGESGVRSAGVGGLLTRNGRGTGGRWAGFGRKI